MRSERPSKRGGKATARRHEHAAAPALSPTALEEADARARAAEAELLAMLDLEDEGAGGASGEPDLPLKGPDFYREAENRLFCRPRGSEKEKSGI